MFQLLKDLTYSRVFDQSRNQNKDKQQVWPDTSVEVGTNLQVVVEHVVSTAPPTLQRMTLFMHFLGLEVYCIQHDEE